MGCRLVDATGWPVIVMVSSLFIIATVMAWLSDGYVMGVTVLGISVTMSTLVIFVADRTMR